MTIRSITALSVTLCALGGVIATARTTKNASAQPKTERIALPSQWVPLSADIVSTHDGIEQYGRFYRKSDGSTAAVLERKVGAVITIHNRQTRLTYVRFGDAEGWVKHPLETEHQKPPRASLLVRQGALERASELIAGAPVYQKVRSDGSATRIAVGLNALPVLSRDARGNGIEYRAIVVGEPPEDVFLPPPDAIVRTVSAGDLRKGATR